jgi:hypothetical protein
MALRIGDRQMTRELPAATEAILPNRTAETSPGEGTAPSPFARVLANLGKEVDRGEHTISQVIHGGGKDVGAGDLLALQAQVYRYSEAVDLAAKLVDRLTSGVKTVLQNQ